MNHPSTIMPRSDKEEPDEAVLKAPVSMLRIAEVCLVFASLAVALSALALFVFKGGALVAKIENHEDRLKKIESEGSPLYVAHKQLDDTRAEYNKESFSELKLAVGVIPQMRLDMQKILDRQDTVIANQGDLKKALEEHEAQTQRTIPGKDKP